jgi:hypothetical protein
MPRFYHRTRRAVARKILGDGFRDGTGTYMTRTVHRGVWLSDVPWDDDFPPSALLAVELPDGLFEEFEWVNEPSTGYREALIPAERINRDGTVTLVDERELGG